jgi:CTP:molybdopterin cytidylyltransferase MocA
MAGVGRGVVESGSERTLGVVLAAGGGTRFAGETHKLLAPFRGRPLVSWAIDAAVAAERAGACVATVVVSGAVSLQGVVPPGVRVVDNGRWQEGQATSLQAGVACAMEGGYDGIVVGLGDQPLVEASAWIAVARALRSAAETTPIVVATYAGVRGNPVGIQRRAWPELPAEGDAGARVLMRRRPEWVVEVACAGDPADVDRVEDLNQWS